MRQIFWYVTKRGEKKLREGRDQRIKPVISALRKHIALLKKTHDAASRFEKIEIPGHDNVSLFKAGFSSSEINSLSGLLGMEILRLTRALTELKGLVQHKRLGARRSLVRLVLAKEFVKQLEVSPSGRELSLSQTQIADLIDLVSEAIGKIKKNATDPETIKKVSHIFKRILETRSC